MGLYDIGRSIFQFIYFPFDMVRRFSRSTFCFVSSLIRYGRVNGGKGLPPKPTTKSLPGSSGDNSTEKTPLLCDKAIKGFSSDACTDCDVESQAHNLKVDLKSGPPSSLSAAAATTMSAGPGHKRAPSKEDLETILPTTETVDNLNVGNTESELLSPPTKRLRQEPGPGTDTVVTIVNEVSIETKKPSRNSVSEAASASSSSPAKEPKWKNKWSKVDTNPKPRMNFFVAIQVQDIEIRSNIAAVQERILNTPALQVTRPKTSKGPTSIAGTVFRDTMVPVEKLHFTLHVVHLQDGEDKEKAKSVLENVWNQCRADFEQNPVIAKIAGLGHFKNNIIFAKMEGTETISRMTSLAETIRAEFESMNIFGETRPFKPHMTVAKMSRSKKLQRKNIKAFPRPLWSEMESMEFGQQRVTSLQLLSMQDKPHPETGYYHALAEFHFNFDTNTNSS